MFRFKFIIGRFSMHKKNVSNLLRLRIPGISQTPYYLKRVKAHAIWREPSTSVLDSILQFGRFRNTRIKSGRPTYMSFLYFSQPIGIQFLGFNNYLFYHDSPYCPGRGSESIMLSEARPCS